MVSSYEVGRTIRRDNRDSLIAVYPPSYLTLCDRSLLTPKSRVLMFISLNLDSALSMGYIHQAETVYFPFIEPQKAINHSTPTDLLKVVEVAATRFELKINSIENADGLTRCERPLINTKPKHDVTRLMLSHDQHVSS